MKSGGEKSGSLEKILERDRIKVATEGAYPPFNYYDESNQLIGYDIDIIKEIADRMDIELKLISVPWVDIFEELKNKEVDLIIAAITITPERAQEMLFTDSYFKTGQAIVIKQSNTDIQGPEDLADKKVGTQVGTTSTEEAIKYADNIKFITYNEGTSAISDLKKEIIDATVMDFEAANQIVKEDGELKIVGGLLSEEYYGIAMNRENIALMERINKILKEMEEDGTITKLEDKWFN